MTFEEYIKNPMGSSVMSNRQMYKDMYTEKWDAIKVRENGIITFKLYNAGEEYFVHFKIPSEVVPKFYYDTVIRFFLPKNKTSHSMEQNLLNYEVQFYSNDPSFVYTFAHAFNSHDLFISDLDNKMSKEALKSKAKEKNPKDEIGYVKSLYFAYLEFKSQNLFTKSRWAGLSSPYSKGVWANTVTHAEDKIQLRQEAAKAISKKEKREANTRKNNEESKNSTTSKFGFVNKMNTKSPNESGFGKFKKSNFNNVGKFVNKISTKVNKK